MNNKHTIMTKTYEFVVRYNREGKRCHDDYYYRRDTVNEALKHVKRDWHKDNDHLFPESVDAEFFVKVDDDECDIRVNYHESKR